MKVLKQMLLQSTVAGAIVLLHNGWVNNNTLDLWTSGILFCVGAAMFVEFNLKK